jgi:hypothetical protein
MHLQLDYTRAASNSLYGGMKAMDIGRRVMTMKLWCDDGGGCGKKEKTVGPNPGF